MIGVTIGIGKAWNEVAHRAADKMAANTGLKCHVIDSGNGRIYEYPSWLKCRILDLLPGEDSYLYFDADVWCMKPWKPDYMFEAFSRDFIAVAAAENDFVKNECLKYDLPLDGKYVCTGLMMFGREHRMVFNYAESLHPNFGLWFDQTPINVALKNERTSMTRIAQRYSAETHGGNYSAQFTGTPIEDVINFHFCSCGGDAARVKELQEKGPRT